jgi:hypothetical protein
MVLLPCRRIIIRSCVNAQIRRIASIRACHHGPGVFNDFFFLFDPVARKMFSCSELAAYSSKFQSIFRLSVDDFMFVRKHIFRDLCPRRDNRGRPPIKVEIIMAAALLYLAHGTTYQTTSIMIRNGLSETSTLRCVRMFTKAVNRRLLPVMIKFPSTIAGLERCAKSFEKRSGIPNIGRFTHPRGPTKAAPEELLQSKIVLQCHLVSGC